MIEIQYDKLVVGKMKDETASVAIKEFVGLKPKMYSFFLDDSREHKKTKGVNKYVVATILRKEYNDVLSHIKCLRHLMNRTLSNNYRIGSYEINKISLPCLDDKILILNNGSDRLVLDYQS